MEQSKKDIFFKQDIQIQNQTLMINEDTKYKLFIRQQKKETYQFNIEIKGSFTCRSCRNV